jgi:hypothetical protein
MRVAVALVCLLAFAVPARAQNPAAEQQKRIGTYKVIAGAGIVAIGLLKVANSSITGPWYDDNGIPHEETRRSTTGTLLGLGATGVGGYLVWDGMKDRAKARPTIGVMISKKKAAVVWQKRW